MKIQILNSTRGTTLANVAEVATDPNARRMGLLGRSDFAEGEGLWIIPAQGIHTYRMRFPIDVVFLGEVSLKDSNECESKVLDFSMNMAPNGSVEHQGASSVLERRAGTIMLTGTKAGDGISLKRIAQGYEMAAPRLPVDGQSCVKLLGL